eukprot:1159286-Pelagomonas_calceolata.AAC.3
MPARMPLSSCRIMSKMKQVKPEALPFAGSAHLTAAGRAVLKSAQHRVNLLLAVDAADAC